MTDANEDFWHANDLLQRRIGENDRGETRRLLGKMVKAYPATDDGDRRASRAISRAALAMDGLAPGFNLAYFVPWFQRLTDDDWQPEANDGHLAPSLGQRIVNRLMRNIASRDAAYIRQVTDLFRLALRHQPLYKHNLRHLAQMHAALARRDEAVAIYKGLLRRHHDSYLYGELAQLTDDPAAKTALLCQAVSNQNNGKFRAKYHFELARQLMAQGFLPRAAYELSQCMAIRTRQRQAVTPEMLHIQKSLEGVAPVSPSEEQVLYDRSISYVERFIRS